MRGKTARLAGDLVPVHPDRPRHSADGAESGQEGESTPPSLARRSGSEKRQRGVLLAIRLTPSERALIDAHAERAGLTTASYARQTLLGSAPPRQVRRPPIERGELSRLLGAIGHVGANLNQIAHHMNAGMPTERGAILSVLQSLVDVRTAILAALGRER